MTVPRTSTCGSLPVPRETLDSALALVREGRTLDDIAGVLGYASGEHISGWRIRYPWFAVALDAAKADGALRRPRRVKSDRVLERVRGGETQAAAAAAEGTTVSAIQAWRRTMPGYRERFAAALAAGRMKRYGAPRKKAQVLTWIARGQSTAEACRRAGCTDADVSRWRREDAGFDTDYARLVGPTRRPRGFVKFHRVLRLIRQGKTVWNAARVARLGPGVPFQWRERYPVLWDEIVQAYVDSGRTPPERRRRVTA